jgi:flavodoxin
MNSVVIYASRHGNTRKVAEAIAGQLQTHGATRLLAAEEAPEIFSEPIDLLVVGGPTEAHRMTEPVARLFDRLGTDSLKGVAAAGFDTRVRWPRWLSGSAGAGITQRLRQTGANVVVPEESFFVEGVTPKNVEGPTLEAGELDRASSWAASLAARLEAKEPVASGTRRNG